MSTTPTATTEDGPLYPPVEIPLRSDLTNDGKANGQLLILMGQVKDHKHHPLSHARVEIWQADSKGYYDHPRARGADALDDYWKIDLNTLDTNFDYYGAVNSDESGQYWFQTIIPRWYHVFGSYRAAHIHLKIRHVDNGVLTTEIYFPGDEQDGYRSKDVVFEERYQRQDLIIDFLPEDDIIKSGVPIIDGAKYCQKDFIFL